MVRGPHLSLLKLWWSLAAPSHLLLLFFFCFVSGRVSIPMETESGYCHPVCPRRWYLRRRQRMVIKSRTLFVHQLELVGVLAARVVECAPVSLVVVFIGRHPHLHTALNPLYEAAREWSADPHLMRSASEALPPSFSDQPCYFPLNETALKTRRWQDGAMESLQRVGYRLFVPKEHRFSSLYPGTEDEIQWFERMAELERTAPFKVAGSMDTGGAGGSESDAEQEGKDVLAPLRSDAVPGTATSSNTRRLSRSSGTSVASAASSAPPSDTQSVRTQQPVVDPRIAAAMAVLREHKAKKANSKTIRSRAPRRVRKVRGKREQSCASGTLCATVLQAVSHSDIATYAMSSVWWRWRVWCGAMVGGSPPFSFFFRA